MTYLHPSMQRKHPLRSGFSPLRKQSPKKRKAQKELSTLRKQLIAERGDICQVKFSPDCRNRAEGTHHIKKRSAGGTDERSNVLLSCNICNSSIEDHPSQAQAAGLVVKSWEVAA